MKRLPFLAEGFRLAPLGAMLTALLMALSAPAWAQTVTGTLKGGTGHSWRYAYDAAVSGETVLITVSFRLVGALDVTPVDLERVSKAWKEPVERLWNGQFALMDAEGTVRPICVAVRFNVPPYHHEVVVRPGRGPDDLLNWHLDDPPEVVAHEVGHAFGVYDEYRGGATAPVAGFIDPQGLMTGSPKKGVQMRERFYANFLEWYRQATGRAARLVPTVSGSVKI